MPGRHGGGGRFSPATVAPNQGNDGQNLGSLQLGNLGLQARKDQQVLIGDQEKRGGKRRPDGCRRPEKQIYLWPFPVLGPDSP